jgi:peptide-methionine (S)-S-oxide reductase
MISLFSPSPAQWDAVLASKAAYQKALTAKGYGVITTEVAEAGPFYFAGTHHQQYLAKNPHGYCGLGGTGVVCSIGTGVSG